MATTVEAPRARASFYRGGGGMLTWVLHRVTGVGIFAFLFAHVLDTSLVVVSPELYDGVMETYKNPIVKVMELGLVLAVVYHGVNGIRVTLVDFWSRGARLNRQMMFVQWVVIAVLSAGASFAMISQLVDEFMR